MTTATGSTETKVVRSVHIVVLAAGKGTRMRSALPKVLHTIAGLPLLDHVLRAAVTLQPATTTVVVGHEAGLVRAHLEQRWPGVTTVLQEPQLGTGHALLSTEPAMAGQSGTVVLLSGDVPLLSPASLGALVARHRDSNAAATVVTAMVERPFGYGRILRAGGEIARIVEERDATHEERDIKEINAGIYAFELDTLFASLRDIGAENAQREYYLPDLVSVFRRQRKAVTTWTISNAAEIRGINSRSELADVGRILRQQKLEELMAAGVTLVDPETTYVDVDVQVGPDSIIHPGVHLEGVTRIGSGSIIHAGTRIADTVIGDRVVVLDHCLLIRAQLADNCLVGPFAHLRPDTVLGAGAKVGNFVELKKTTLGAGAKANHLAYVGDATVGEKSNIGAGTITCNYDGVGKHQTIIGRGAFVGSNATLVAPLTIGDGAYIAAGSAITEDVPADALALGRSRQETKPEWAAKRRALQRDVRKP